jgi:hypothetical protein
VENENQVQLKTFEWWTEEACNITQLITLNSFNKATKNWQKPLTIPQKFTNFHNCTFVTFTSMHRAFCVDSYVDIYDEPASAQPAFLVWREVLDNLIMDIFAEKGNYSVIPVISRTEPGLQIIQLSRMYHEHEQYHEGYKLQPYLENYLVMLIPRANVYNSYEKLLFPFDKVTWILLVVTFSVTIVAISILNSLPASIHERFRLSFRASYMDILSIFFGFGVTHVPHSGHARMILLSFLIFCFMIRILHQGFMKIISLKIILKFSSFRFILRYVHYGHQKASSRNIS